MSDRFRAAGSKATALPYAANWADVGGGWQPADYRRIGLQVFVRGLAIRSGSASGAGATIATLPVGFRPTGGLQLLSPLANTGSAPFVDQVYVDTSGNIQTGTSIAVGQLVFLFGSFFTD